jgi:hypothetical protein
MKNILATIAVAALCAAPAYAQQARSVAGAQAISGSNAQSSSGAIAGGGTSSVNILPNPSATTSNNKVDTIPSGVVGPGFGSGHPCAYSPVSIGVAVIGAGVSGGGQKVDEACLLAQMGYSQEAMYIIASRDRRACLALRSAGKIGPGSCGGSDKTGVIGTGNTAQAAVRPAAVASTQEAGQPSGYTRCVRSDKGFRIRYSGSTSKAVAQANCKAKLGL